MLNLSKQFQADPQSINEIIHQVYNGDIKSIINSEESEEHFKIESTSSSESLTEKPYLKKSKVLLANWLTISSQTFGDNRKFPEINTVDGRQRINYHKNFKRTNPTYKKGTRGRTEFDFWFRLTPGFIYYTFNKKDINIAGALNIKQITDLKWRSEGDFCMIITDISKSKWDVCGKGKETMTKWFCQVLKQTSITQEDICDPEKYTEILNLGKVVIKTITQPLIIIPTPSKHCNTVWNYAAKGNDWECLCKEGNEQSPIDLPPPEKAVETDVKPVMQYEFIGREMQEDFMGVKKGDINVIRYENYALRIHHPNFGKLVTLDGGVYIAQEIVFHTPSEHQIDGVTYDMEMEIIHYGQSVGDTLKQAILSVMFTSKSGIFNKFIDKLNFFDLPNPLETTRNLWESIYIPHVFHNSESNEDIFLAPFSFYTYQGSASQPPCNENVIRYIASKPIPLSSTVLHLFKEALRFPDMIDAKGNIKIVANAITENNRELQKLNGRTVFHYDHSKYCPDLIKIPTVSRPKERGHYEKRVKESVEYIFVNGEQPSKIPGAFVVTEKEAKG